MDYRWKYGDGGDNERRSMVVKRSIWNNNYGRDYRNEEGKGGRWKSGWMKEMEKIKICNMEIYNEIRIYRDEN